ncbi:hypothetical protein C2857_002905 [Epichloe festucae Fl1]|uniref:Thioredoxin n=1 Tax=Epichloe festucae (strain Fl1) TaxID=877507 RepID=A0A7S9KRX8_EPIFF|nr:hypothetical protein C2857_002905 [Epichloe festucae Fl1]
MSQSLVTIGSKEQFDALLEASKIVVADFFATWCGPCQQIAPVYEALAQTLGRANVLTFVKVDTEKNKALAEEYQVTALPTFILFQDGKATQTVKGADPVELRRIIKKLVTEVDSLGEGSSSGSSGDDPWVGAEIPRGYSDITHQVEIRNCELLNAEEDAGPVKVLFESSKPESLSKAKVPAKDFVQSGADDQLLLFVPFEGSVKLHTLQITSIPEEGQDEISRPEVVHLYINRPQNMDFSEADDTEPTQVITLQPGDWNPQGTASINLRFVKFQKTTTLILYVQKGTDGADAVRLDRIRFIGDAGTKREMGKLQKIGNEG